MPLGERLTQLEGPSPAKISPKQLNVSIPSTSPTQTPVESQSPLSDGEITDNETMRADSPTLDDLNEKKKRLLNALDDSSVSITTLVQKPSEDDSLIDDIMALQDDSVLESTGISDENGDTSKVGDASCQSNDDSSPATPDTSLAVVNKSLLHASIETVGGTPVIKAFSPFSNLPKSEKWREGVTDVLDFENLPESIGKYEKMRTLLGTVREKVKRIQYEDEDSR